MYSYGWNRTEFDWCVLSQLCIRRLQMSIISESKLKIIIIHQAYSTYFMCRIIRHKAEWYLIYQISHVCSRHSLHSSFTHYLFVFPIDQSHVQFGDWFRSVSFILLWRCLQTSSCERDELQIRLTNQWRHYSLYILAISDS